MSDKKVAARSLMALHMRICKSKILLASYIDIDNEFLRGGGDTRHENEWRRIKMPVTERSSVRSHKLTLRTHP